MDFLTIKKSSLIPDRPSNAMTGSEFIQANMNLMDPKRDANALKEILSGNIPDFYRDFKPIEITKGTNKITYLVSPDYVSIGSNEDYVRMSIPAPSAQKIANAFDCSLPTARMVYQIWEQSVNKLAPSSWGPPYDSDMMKTHRIGTHNQRIQDKLKGKDYTQLTSGHKKDIVLTNALYPNNPLNKVAIYGWIQLNGIPIQNLNPTSHFINFNDYSQGIRLIANDVMVNGELKRLQDIFAYKTLCKLVSDESPLLFQSYI